MYCTFTIKIIIIFLFIIGTLSPWPNPVQGTNSMPLYCNQRENNSACYNSRKRKQEIFSFSDPKDDRMQGIRHRNLILWTELVYPKVFLYFPVF